MYCDADWCNKQLITIDGKCTSGAVNFFHSNAIDWSCQKQQDVSASTREEEYKQLTYGMRQTCNTSIYFRKRCNIKELLSSLGETTKELSCLHNDLL